MGSTTHGYPYPESTDTPDVPRDIRALAEKIDAAVGPADAWIAQGGAAGAPQGSLVTVASLTVPRQADCAYLIEGLAVVSIHGAAGAYLAGVGVSAHILLDGTPARSAGYEVASGSVCLPVSWLHPAGASTTLPVTLAFRLDGAAGGGAVILGGTLTVRRVRP